jgi:NADPH:quinone reductase-like Zn-dependent oxidoreductase
MRAIIYNSYGKPEVLKIEEVQKPIPKDNEILIKVLFTTVTSGDYRLRSLNVPRGFKFIMRLVMGFSKPKQRILGSELCGIIELVGKNVTKFKVGDEVVAFNDIKMGSYAEFISIPETNVVTKKPKNLNFAESSAISFGGTTALSFFQKANLQKDESVLIIGASGGVGTAAIQIAKYFGAKLTAVCSDSNSELVKKLGADEFIDYQKVDITKLQRKFDVVMDTIGNRPFKDFKNLLKPNARFLMVVGSLSEMLKSFFYKEKIISSPVFGKIEDLEFLVKLAEENKFKPYIDKILPFEKIVEAHAYVESGRRKGNLVIQVSNQILNTK